MRNGSPNGSSAYPDRMIEWLFSCMMISWGLWLLVPGWQTFANPQYRALALIAGEPTWGIWSVMVGVVRAGALYINGSHWRTPLIRFICSSLGLIWWLTLIYLFLLSPQENPAAGFSWYPVFVVFEGISCWRCAADGWHTQAFDVSSVKAIVVGGRRGNDSE